MPLIRSDPLVDRMLIGSKFLGLDLDHHPPHVPSNLVGLFFVHQSYADELTSTANSHEEQHSSVPPGHRGTGPIDPKHPHLHLRGLVVKRMGRQPCGAHVPLNAAPATAAIQQRQELLHAPIAQTQHIQHYPKAHQPPASLATGLHPGCPKRSGRLVSWTLHTTLGNARGLDVADGTVANGRMNPHVVAPAMRTTPLKLENPFDRWQYIANHLGLLAVDGLYHPFNRQRGRFFDRLSTLHGTVTCVGVIPK